MLFKERLLLSNCDSVRQLDGEEIRKRFMTGLAFSDGVVLSPNTLLDNQQIHELISKRNVVKYLNEEGYGKLVIRGFGLADEFSLMDYYNALPPDFIISSLPGRPKKAQITPAQEQELYTRLQLTQKALNNVGYSCERLELPRESLRNEVFRRLEDAQVIGHFFASEVERELFRVANQDKISRSQWYQVADDYFGTQSPQEAERFKAEIINPAYNFLFAAEGEGFLQDNIKVISNIPAILLDTGVLIRSLRREIALIEYPLKAFEIISSFGTGELVKYLTDEAMGYIEDKLVEKGEAYLTRKNWFGMYGLMRKMIGLEVK